jgi:hypothetical protein
VPAGAVIVTVTDRRGEHFLHSKDERRASAALRRVRPVHYHYNLFVVHAWTNKLNASLPFAPLWNLEIFQSSLDKSRTQGSNARRHHICWGRKPPPPLIINPIALLESLLVFCTLAARIQEHTEPPNCGVHIGVELRGLGEDNRPLLPPGPVGGIGWNSANHSHEAPERAFGGSVTWGGKIDPGRLAFRVATRIYEWFGITHDRIPYAAGDGDQRRIDDEAFRKF